MNRHLQILMLDDNPNDAQLASHALSESGMKCSMVRVESETDFVHELEYRPPDIILSDSGLPSFSGIQALALTRSKRPETPFILVCGSPTTEFVGNAVRKGAQGYVSKDRMEALAPMIEHAIQISEERAAWKAAEADLKQNIEDLQKALDSIKLLPDFIHVCAHCKRMRDEESEWMHMESYIEAHSPVMLSHGICPSCAQTLFGDILHGDLKPD